jgi:hypothetical protein
MFNAPAHHHSGAIHREPVRAYMRNELSRSTFSGFLMVARFLIKHVGFGTSIESHHIGDMEVGGIDGDGHAYYLR